MHNLPAHVFDASEDFDSLRARRRPATAARLAIIRGRVLAACSLYDREQTRLNTVERLPLDALDKRALLGNFAHVQRGRSHGYIREDILATTVLGQCPYCSLSEATTLDHVLEKALFPEFATLRSNLVPCCRDCNAIREETRLNSPAGEAVFHLYAHGFPETRFIDVRLTRQGGYWVYAFDLYRPQGVGALWFQALQAHFSRTRLRRRYGLQATILMQELSDELQEIRQEIGIEGVATFLLRRARYVERSTSPNDWRAALYRAAAASVPFCDQPTRAW